MTTSQQIISLYLLPVVAAQLLAGPRETGSKRLPLTQTERIPYNLNLLIRKTLFSCKQSSHQEMFSRRCNYFYTELKAGTGKTGSKRFLDSTERIPCKKVFEIREIKILFERSVAIEEKKKIVDTATYSALN